MIYQNIGRIDAMHQLLERHMAQATTRDVGDEPLASAIDRLAMEGDFLIQTNRHHWVRRRASDLTNYGNWPAYAMEIHLSYVLESVGIQIRNGVNCLTGSGSDIDIVWHHANGIEIRVECVALRELRRFWNDQLEIASGIEVRTASHDLNGESYLLRAVQNKIRQKSITSNGAAIKFPEPDQNTVQLIIADVSNAAGWDPDWWDLQEIMLGSTSALHCWRHNLVGLFESCNGLGTDRDADFNHSCYIRERIHGIIFAIDESSMHHPLNPDYYGHYVLNPLLPFSAEQQEALSAIAMPLHALMTRGWLQRPQIRSENC